MAKRINELDLNSSPNPLTSMVAIDGSTTEKTPMSQFTGTNVKIVNSMADFPDAVSGVRTLAANTTYAIGANITTPDRFVGAAGVEVCGFGSGASKLTYTGSSNFFTITDIDFEFRNFTVDLSNTGTFISTSSTSGFNFILFADVMIFNAAKLGSSTNTSISMTNCNVQFFADGWSLAGSLLFFQNFLVGYLDNTASSTTIDFGTAVINNIAIRDSVISGSGTGFDGASASANIASGSIAVIDDTAFAIATPLSVIARDDFRWEFNNCRGVLNTQRLAEGDLTSTETVTIGSSGVYVQITGSSWNSSSAESFTISSGGSITYIGEVTRKFYVGITATIEKVGGGADEICMRVGKDTGSGFVTEARTTSCTQNATPTSVYSHGFFDLDEGDILGAFVANNTNATDIDVTVSSYVVFEI